MSLERLYSELILNKWKNKFENFKCISLQYIVLFCEVIVAHVHIHVKFIHNHGTVKILSSIQRKSQAKII